MPLPTPAGTALLSPQPHRPAPLAAVGAPRRSGRGRLVNVGPELRSVGTQPAVSLKIAERHGIPVCIEEKLRAHPDGPEIRPAVRAAMIDPGSREKGSRKWKRWERGAPMELWQMDVR